MFWRPGIGARRNFCRGGGGKFKNTPDKDKKSPNIEKKVAKRPTHGEKGHYKEKNSKKAPP